MVGHTFDPCRELRTSNMLVPYWPLPLPVIISTLCEQISPSPEILPELRQSDSIRYHALSFACHPHSVDALCLGRFIYLSLSTSCG